MNWNMQVRTGRKLTCLASVAIFLGGGLSAQELYSGWENDVEFIEKYIASAPPLIQKPLPEYVCEAGEQIEETYSIEIHTDSMRVNNYESRHNEACPQQIQYRADERFSCIASLSNLSSDISIGSSLAIQLRCINGECFTCNRQ